MDWVAGVLWVLGRARDGGLGYCVGLATAAARWRPSGARVCVAETGKLQREGKRAARSSDATCGCHREQEVACGPPRQWAAPLSAGGREKQRSREVGDEVWTDLQFPKSLGALL